MILFAAADVKVQRTSLEKLSTFITKPKILPRLPDSTLKDGKLLIEGLTT